MRTILEADIISIKGATEASYVNGGGVTSMHAFTRATVSTLSKYASVNRIRDDEVEGCTKLEYGDRIIPVDIAIEVDKRCVQNGTTPWIITEAARQLGYRLEPLQDALRTVAKISERDAHVILSEAMDVSRLLIAAFDDGRLDALEKKQLRKELRDVISAAQQILDKMEGE